MTVGTSDLDAIRSALDAIAPPGLRVGARQVGGHDWSMLPAAEQRLVVSAVERRRDAFASGRVLLRSLVGSPEPILIGATGAPLLADGTVGSLAHEVEIAVAVVGQRSRYRALGVDIELIGAAEDELADIILRNDESDLDPTLGFVLKEAAYKTWSNAGGPLLGHHDVRVEIDGQAFVATVVDDAVEIHGSFTAAARRWVALGWMPAESDAVRQGRAAC